jgi:hypothetical protein
MKILLEEGVSKDNIHIELLKVEIEKCKKVVESFDTRMISLK